MSCWVRDSPVFTTSSCSTRGATLTPGTTASTQVRFALLFGSVLSLAQALTRAFRVPACRDGRAGVPDAQGGAGPGPTTGHRLLPEGQDTTNGSEGGPVTEGALPRRMLCNGVTWAWFVWWPQGRIQRDRRKERREDVTFIMGPPGIYSQLAVLHTIEGDEQEAEQAAREVLRQKERVLRGDVPFEVLYGAAGYLYALLFVKAHAPELIPASAIEEVVAHIFNKAEQHGPEYVSRASIHPLPSIPPSTH